MSQIGARIMARVAPASSGITRHFQGYWMTGIAPGALGRPFSRPMASLTAVLGGNGSGGAIGGGKGGNGGSSRGPGGQEQGPTGGSSSGFGRIAAMVLAGGALVCGEGAAWAGKKASAAAEPPKTQGGELTVDKVTEMLSNLAVPILTNLGFSGCVGAAAGFALKKVGQFLAFCVGMAFLFIQGLAYTGFITVNWTHVHSSVFNTLDFNKDGKVDAEDFKPMLNTALAGLSQGVPSVGGFLAGFMLAIRTF